MPWQCEVDIDRGDTPLFFIGGIMNYDKVKLIAHNLKLLAISLEEAVKEDPDKYLKDPSDKRFGYRFDGDDDGYQD